jgi:hypothetical protein
VAAGRSTAGTSNATSLSITSGAALNLNDQDLVIDWTGSSPAADVRTQLTTGYGSGSWTGTGISSSSAAAAATSLHRTALGHAESSELFTSFPASFSGQSVDSTSLLVRYVYSGDANLDGKVTTLDFNLLAGNFSSAGRWFTGDFNYDGTVDSLDFGALVANYGMSMPTPASPLGVVVPEPTIFGMLLLGSVQAMARRRERVSISKA